MSESQEDAEKKKSDQKKVEQTGTQETPSQPVSKPVAPRVGTPIGQPASRPQVGTPIEQTTPRPQVGTPIGAQKPTSTPVARPTVGTPRPTVGTPVGSPRPTVGTPRPAVGTPVGTSSAAPAVARPVVATPAPTPSVSKPAAPAKPPESKAEISRRNFIKGLAVIGGVVAVAPFAAFSLPYLQGSVGGSTGAVTQTLLDSSTGATLKSSNSNISSPNSWTTFIYPYTGNANIDDDTFRQWVIIHLPKGWTAGTFGTVDPISGDTFVALSRVCLHLWCLWSYVPTEGGQIEAKGICPCHGSQYLPGGPAGTAEANEAGLAVAGPASLQTPPNNWLSHATIQIASDGTISASNIVGQVGCGLNC